LKPDLKPRHFEAASYIAWGLTASLIAVKYKKQRDYWYALLGGSLLFPFEWFADNHMLFMKYSTEFTPLLSHDFMPLFMFFAYGWFFSTTLIANLQFEKKLDAIPLWKQISLLYSIFCIWDFAVEYPACSYEFWTYSSNVKKIGPLPWVVPFSVAVVNVGMYYVHKFARKHSADKSWLKGLAIHTAAYWAFLATGAAIAWKIRELNGHHAV